MGKELLMTLNHLKSSTLLRLLLVLALALSLACSASAESYEADTMRLLRHEGTVEIFDVQGNPRFLLDNVRFASGEAMRTGADGLASVGLDDSKIVTLDHDTRVEFVQEAEHILLNLTEGSIFLDVSKKLDMNEALDIQTTTMTVGIRGTIVFASSRQDPGTGTEAVTLGVLEGTAEVNYVDQAGSNRVLVLKADRRLLRPLKKARSLSNRE